MNFERSLKLHPTAIMYIANGRELTRSVDYLAEVMTKGIDVPYEPLREIIDSAGVKAGMAQAEAKRRLTPFAEDILRFVYTYIVDGASDRDIQPVWVFLPQTEGGNWQDETEAFAGIADEAGFTVLRLDDVYEQTALEQVWLADWDRHPNQLGHQLIADALFEELRENRERVFVLKPATDYP